VSWNHNSHPPERLRVRARNHGLSLDLLVVESVQSRDSKDDREALIVYYQEGYKAIYIWSFKCECVRTHLYIDPTECLTLRESEMCFRTFSLHKWIIKKH
jgi:hypothetical protein